MLSYDRNGTDYDITNILKWPAVTTGSVRGSNYQFTYTPCTSRPCDGITNGSALCQVSSLTASSYVMCLI
jgi:hypothetical protein